MDGVSAGPQITITLPHPGPILPTMTSALILGLACSLSVSGQALAENVAPVLSPGLVQYPAVSPDGKSIVFSWMGDLWIGPSAGGAATRLTSHPADDRRGILSPDGSRIAFESDRDGGRNIYVMPLVKNGAAGGGLASGPVSRITVSDRAQTLAGWSPDGSTLLFGEANVGIHRAGKMYRVSVETKDGATRAAKPSELITEAFGLSPRMTTDGSAMTFSRRRPDFTRPRYTGSGASDVWAMNVSDGSFTQVTADASTDAEAFPIGPKSVVFLSSRTGTYNLWQSDLDGKNLTQLTTFAPTPEQITIGHGVRDLSVSAQAKVATFIVWDTLYTLDLAKPGNTPKAVQFSVAGDVLDTDTTRINLAREVTEAVLSPDGKTVAMVARGEIFVRSTDENWPTRRVTATAGREKELAWSPDGRVLWFTSDEGGVNRPMYAMVTLSREDIEEKKPTPKDEEKKEEGKSGEEPKTEPKGEASSTLNSGLRLDGGLETRPPEDAQPAEPKVTEPKPAEPEAKPAEGASPTAAPARRAVSREKNVDFGKRWAESIAFETKPLDTSIIAPGANNGRNDGILGMELSSPTPSPDGRQLLLTRGLGDLVVVDLVAKTSRTIVEGWNMGEALWASDARHVIYSRDDLDFNSDIFVLDSADTAAKPMNLTQHPDGDDQPRLSADGKVLIFRSERAGENFDFGLYAINLDPSLDAMRPYELEDYYKKQSAAAKARKPIDAVLWDDAKWVAGDAERQDKAKKAAEKNPTAAPSPFKPLTFAHAGDAYLRVRRLNVGSASVGAVLITPAADRIIFSQSSDAPPTPAAPTPPTPPAPGAAAAPIGSEPGLVSISYKGDDRKPITSGALRSVSVSLAGDKVAFVRSGQAGSAPVLGGKVDSLTIDAPITLDLKAQQRQKFLEAARVMGNGFYHPTLKGLNWKGLTERYLALAERTRTNAEFDRVFSMMLGELDGSHVGINGPDAFTPPTLAVGYLGLEAKPSGEGLVVTRVIEDGPAADHPRGPRLGDLITSIDGQPAANRDLAGLLISKANRETLLTFTRAAANVPEAKADVKADAKVENKPITIIITPTTAGDETNLRYKAEVAARRANVEKLSGGRLGYLHIRGMSEPSVRDFERDLFAAANGKEGLVIDVRDNGGGSTADILLASLTAPVHAKTQPRGVMPQDVPFDAYPRDRRLIYSWARPIVVLINENSFSNAEIFAHAVQTIGRGKLVGTPTYGGVISTGSATLIDGTTIRTPFRGWYLPDGRDQDNNGAQPSAGLNVPALPQDEAAGRDAQLEAAVKELLGGK